MHSQFEKNMSINNTVDACTMDYKIVLLLSETYGTISPQKRAVLLQPTAGGPFHMPVRMYFTLVLSVRLDEDKDFVMEKRSVLEKRGLCLCYTAGGLFESVLMPQNIILASALPDSLADGVFCFLPISYIPVRQQFLAIRAPQALFNANIIADRSLLHSSGANTIAHARGKEEDIVISLISKIILIILVLLNGTGLRLTEIVSVLDHPEQDSTISIFFTGGAASDSGREAPRNMTLRLTKQKGRVLRRFEDLIFTMNEFEVTIGDLFSLPMLSNGSQTPAVDDCIRYFIIAGTMEFRKLGVL